MTFNRITESESKYDHLEKMSIIELLENINREDKSVPIAIEKIIPAIEKLVDLVSPQHNINGGLIKDIAAGAVLILAIVSVIIGLIVFVPKVF